MTVLRRCHTDSRGEGFLTAFVFHGRPLEPGNYARKHKNRGNELNKLLRMNDLTFLALENELGLMCKIGPIEAKKLEIGEEEVKQKGLSAPVRPSMSVCVVSLWWRLKK